MLLLDRHLHGCNGLRSSQIQFSTSCSSRALWSDSRSYVRFSKRRAMEIPSLREESLKAVLFDIDGTLCDSDALHFVAYRELFKEIGFQNGVPITEEFFAKNISGGDNHDLGIKLFPDWDQDRRYSFLREKETRFRRLAAKHLKPVKGLENLCHWVEKQGLRRGAVTNSPRESAEHTLSLLGLESFFEVVIIGDECERPKPFPDPYEEAVKNLGISPDQAFVLEDSSTGLRAAVGAGLLAIGVATRNPEQSLLAAGAAFVISDFNDTKLWNALEGQPQKLQY